MLRPSGSARLLLLLALAACTPKPQYPECKTDPDCADHGQVCLNGFCKECRDDTNCAGKPDKPVCRDAICTAKPQCQKNEDCAAGLRCAEEKCVPECSEQTAAQDCGEGKKCIAGRCAAEESCNADADCRLGQACVDRLCKAQGDLEQSMASRQLGECEVRAVYFGFDDATLEPESRRQLDADFACLQKAELRRVRLEGHTDERGTTEYNLALGERRADAVKKYLSGLGLEPRKLRAISYGKERPADPGHDEASWARNRRVELAPEK
jgi:peptidoglycan-associated lipoprotein